MEETMPLTTVASGRVYDWSHAVGRGAARGTGFNYIQTMCLGKGGVIYTAKPGSGDGELLRPAGLAVEKNGNIIVVDSGNNRLQVFSPDGKFVGKCGSAGNRPGEFNQPWGITLDKDGNIFVADWKNHRVQKLTGQGKPLICIGEYGAVEAPEDSYAVTYLGPYIAAASEKAGNPSPNKLNHPTDVAVDSDG